ncbi:MAG: alpha/beta fold hydrolase [Gemmobacter sp.]
MLYRFGAYTLDLDRRELSDGAQPVATEPQVFDLLEFLVRCRDRVVSRDDLIEAVWGGRIVSDSTLATRVNAARHAIGDDGTTQRWIRTVARRGFRFVGEVTEEADGQAPPGAGAVVRQTVTFCHTGDGVDIATATAGSGPTMVKVANWLNHLEHDWHSPVWAPFYTRLAARFRLVRYDGRGNGLSDRNVGDISFAGFERDLEAVTGHLGLKRFVLFGMSQGAAVAVAHAARHPDRISRLILYGAYARGRNRRDSPVEEATAATVQAMMREGWGRPGSAFMRAFSTLYLPGGTSEQIGWFADLQRLTTSGEIAARLRSACDEIDVRDCLSRVTVPTLVLHAMRDPVVPVEEGRLVARRIPGARFVALASGNHIPLPDDPAWEILLAEIERFATAGA